MKKKILFCTLTSAMLLGISSCGISKLNVKFETNGGTLVGPVSEVKEGQEVTLPKASKTGYTFTGWFLDEGLTQKIDNLTYTFTEDVTLYAGYSINQYSLTFTYYYDEGFSQSNMILVDYGTAVKLEDYSLGEINFDFVKWVDEKTNNEYTSKDEYVVKEDSKLKGTFKKSDTEYVLNEDSKSYSLNSIGEFAGTTYEVPTSYRGLPVTGINANTFNDAINITSLKVGENIKSIDFGAFSSLINLKTLEVPFIGAALEDSGILGHFFGESTFTLQGDKIPETLENLIITKQEVINSNALYNAKSLKSVEFKNAKKILKSTFEYCPNVEKLVLNEGLEVIESSGLKGLKSLTELNIPSTVKTIENYAFSGLPLTTLKLPKALENFGSKYDISTLKAFEISDENANFKVVDGVLYDKTGSTVVAYPQAKEGETFKLLDSVTKVGNAAFYMSNIKSVDLNKVVNLGEESFRYSKLESVVLPETLLNIGKTSFSGCPALTSVTFAESLVEGDKLTLRNFAFSSSPKLASIVLPAYITDIPEYFLSGDSSITELKINGSIKSIGKYAFSDINVSNVAVKFQDAATIGDRIFNGSTVNVFEISFDEGVTNMPTFTGDLMFGDSVPTIKVEDNAQREKLKEAWPTLSPHIQGQILSCFTVDGTTLKGYTETADSTVITEIPENVTTLAAGCLSAKATTIRHLVLPESVTTIERGFIEGGKLENLLSIELKHKDLSKISADSLKNLNGSSIHATIIVDDSIDISSVQDQFKYSTMAKVTVVHSSDVVKNDNSLLSKDGTIMYKAYAKDNTFVVPETVKTIGVNCFYESNIQTVDLKNVERIEENGFAFSTITTVESNKLSYIGPGAFQYCEKLTSVKLIGGNTVIDECGFSDGGQITKIVISGVSEIKYGAFMSAFGSDATCVVPKTISKIDCEAFEDSGLATLTFENTEVEVIAKITYSEDDFSSSEDAFNEFRDYYADEIIFAE